MDIPTPNPVEIKEFKRLYSQFQGVELSDSEALDLATHGLQLYFFGITLPPCVTDSMYENLRKKTKDKLNQLKTRARDAKN